MVILLITLLININFTKLAPCYKSFPVVLGGSGGGSVMNAFDFHALTFSFVSAGDSYDPLLKGDNVSDGKSIIIFHKGEKPVLIWAKYFNVQSYFVGAVFNTDGSIIATHTNGKILTIMRSADGSIVT